MVTGWVMRALVSAHVVAIFGQPVFAGVYLSGDYDGLRWHAAGANVVTSIGYLQVIAAIVVWVRLRQAWPFLATLALVAPRRCSTSRGWTARCGCTFRWAC